MTGVDPAEGPEDGQTTIVLTGSRFTDASAVAFGDAVADGVSVDSDTQVTAVSPAGTGTVDITVTTPAGTSTTTDADAFTYRPAGSLPTINRIDPCLIAALGLVVSGLLPAVRSPRQWAGASAAEKHRSVDPTTDP